MTVGFFLVDNGSVDASLGFTCADALTASVHQSMPGVGVVQFTDERTDAVRDVDDVRRLPIEPLAVLRMRHHAAVSGEWLFVDSDVIVQRDVRDVFQQPFDVALTTRDWTHLKVAAGFSERMPYNVGVVFSRTRSFWKEALKRVALMEESARNWMGDQQAICDITRTSRYRIALLKGSRYNYPPALVPDADGEKQQRKAHIVHYKGSERKGLLLERIRRDKACGSA